MGEYISTYLQKVDGAERDEVYASLLTLLSRWNGKSWAVLGDSITTGNTWQGYVTARLGLVVTNFGVSGTRISGTDGDPTAMCQDARINAIAATFDVVTMMGGINDWQHNVALGDEDSRNPVEFNGALNRWAAKAYARWPTKRLAIATTPYAEALNWKSRRGWTGSARNALGFTTNDYADCIRKACRRLNVPCIDVASNGGWGTTNISDALGNTTDHFHPTIGSFAAKNIAQAHRALLAAVEPIA